MKADGRSGVVCLRNMIEPDAISPPQVTIHNSPLGFATRDPHSAAFAHENPNSPPPPPPEVSRPVDELFNISSAVRRRAAAAVTPASLSYTLGYYQFYRGV